jgi:hypothetical protein
MDKKKVFWILNIISWALGIVAACLLIYGILHKLGIV